MATTLIDTRKSIMEQIHASWNQFRTLDYAHELLGFQYPDTCKRFLEPMAKDFKKNDAPWSIKQSVLERNAVHANKLIRLYIALNIETKKRMHIWQFFEVNSGVVGRIKEEIAILKRIQKVLKLERELEVHEPLPSATSLYLMTGNLSLAEIEADFKVKVSKAAKAAKEAAKAAAKAEAKAQKEAKKLAAAKVQAEKAAAKEAKKLAAKQAKAAAKEAKKLAAKQAKAAAKAEAKAAKTLLALKAKESAKARKLDEKLAKKTIALLKWAQENDFELKDIVNILESEIESARSDSNMVTIIDIA